MDTKRGYFIVDMGLSLPEHHLSDDEMAQCLSYTLKHLDQIPDLLIPNGVGFEIIKVTYVGGPYPCIGMYSVGNTDSNEHLTDVSLDMERVMEKWANAVGLQNLLEVSKDEPLTWQDVLNGVAQ